MNELPNPSKALVVAQFSDCHLFADTNALHHGANVYQHLQRVLADIANRENIDIIIFTGDLSQDHSSQSYQNFAEAVSCAKLNVPVYYVAGNHDELSLLTTYLKAPIFSSDKTITHNTWQIQLLNSKSDTPAGLVSQQSLAKLSADIKKDKFQLLMMHHHPVDVGYFIDRHGLTNQAQFWQTIQAIQQASNNIKAIACGHVHRASFFGKQTENSPQCVDVYTCPATSIAFDPKKQTVSSLGEEPSYRLFSLFDNGTIDSEIIYPTIANR